MANNPIPKTDVKKCIGCKLCCEIPCFARVFKPEGPTLIIDLCSGCGWCSQICPNNAIKMVNKK